MKYQRKVVTECKIKEAVNEYLTTNLSSNEIAMKFNISRRYIFLYIQRHKLRDKVVPTTGPKSIPKPPPPPPPKERKPYIPTDFVAELKSKIKCGKIKLLG